MTKALSALTYPTPATSCLTCMHIAQRYCVDRVTCNKYFISITSPSSSSLSSSCKVPWWCTPTADDQWRFLVLLTYSCQTLISLCLENTSKTFPAWPAARNFMLIISAFVIPSPVLLTYSCQTSLRLCLENARKPFPAWPAARNFMLIISAFPIRLPSFLSEVENWFPQGCHIIAESGFTCNFTHISIAIDWVFFFVSKNTKTEW